MLDLPSGKTFACWLDGRNTKSEGNHEIHSDHGHGGAMTLRAASFDSSGHLSDEAELDNRICDCCQTSAALTDNGIIVAYRDRTENEIRDISVVRQVDGQWSNPTTVYNDNWKIAGCPVNGPSIKAIANTVAVAWFGISNNESQVKLAFSKDGGANFLPPIRLDHGSPIGRIDLVLTSELEAYVSWIEEVDDEGSIVLANVTIDGIVKRKDNLVPIELSRNSGFPVLTNYKEDLILAWTDVDSIGITHVKSAIIK
jgi:hypothetical protein